MSSVRDRLAAARTAAREDDSNNVRRPVHVISGQVKTQQQETAGATTAKGSDVRSRLKSARTAAQQEAAGAYSRPAGGMESSYLPSSPRYKNTAYERSGVTRDQYDSAVRSGYAARQHAEETRNAMQIASLQKQLGQLQTQKGELEAGLDLNGAAELQQEIDSLKKQLEQAQKSEQFRNRTTQERKLDELREKKGELEAGLDLTGAAEIQSQIDSLNDELWQAAAEASGARKANLADLTIGSVKRGYLNSVYGQESYQEMMGRENQAEEYAGKLADEAYNFLPKGKLAQGVSGAAELLGQQVRQWTDPESLILGMGAAGAAGLAGQMGPQVLLPEETFTMPAAFLTGIQMGSAKSNFEIEAGLAYQEMLENGISPDTASKVASVVGLGNAALELVQMDELVKSFRVLNQSGAADGILKAVGDELLKRGLDVAQETAQEVAQEGVTIAGSQLASRMEKGQWAYGADEVLERLGDTAMSSALSFGMMNVPVGAHNVYQQTGNKGIAQSSGPSVEYQSASGAPNELLVQAAEQMEQNGTISGKMADRILADQEAVAYLQQAGALDLSDGMKQTERRSAVKSSMERLASLTTDMERTEADEDTQDQQDALTRAIGGGQRVDYDALTEEQITAWNEHHDDVWVDAEGKVYQMDPEQHISQRTADGVSSRAVNAFQFDHPELRSYYKQAASDLIKDASLSLDQPKTGHYERTTQGKRYVQNILESHPLRYAMDMGLTRGEIIHAAEALVADHGQENYAAAKRLEFVLDDMLTSGYTTVEGETFGPNEDYIQKVQSIPGYRVQEHDELPIWDMDDTSATEAQANTYGPATLTARARNDAELSYDIQQVRRAASALGENGSRALSTVYDGDMARYYDPKDVTESFFQVYNAALNGEKLTEEAERLASAMPEHLRLAAKSAAERDAVRAAQAKYFGDKAGLVRDANWKKAHLSSKTSRVLDALGKALGVEVRFAETVNDGQANAQYENGVITIALDAQDPVLTSLVHEIVHRVREASPGAYQTLADFVRQNMTEEGMDFNLAQRSRLYQTTDADYLTEEMVADAFGQMLGNEDVMGRFAQENRTLAQRICDALTDIVNAIQRVLRRQNLRLTEAQRAAFRDLESRVSAMERTLSDALKEAGKEAANKNTATQQDGDAKFSIKRTSQMTLAQQLKMFYDGKMASSDAFYFGVTPAVLEKSGFDALPLAMTIGDFRKSTQKKHNIPRRVLKNLMGNLASPLFSFGSGDRAGIVLNDIDGDGYTLLAALERGTDMDRKPVNVINSLYGLEHPAEWIKNQIDSENEFVLYDEKRANAFLQTYGYMASVGDGIRSMGESLTQNGGEVKSKFSLKAPVEETKNLLAIHNKDTASSLQDKSGDGTMGATRNSLKEDLENGRAREETRGAFLRRAAGAGYAVHEGKTAAYGFRRAGQPNDGGISGETTRSAQTQQELTSLGISADVIDGPILRNQNGVTSVRAVNQSVTVDRSHIFISKNATLPPRNIAGHEAFHLWKNGVGRDAYIETVEDNLLFSSEAFLEYQSSIAETYLGGEADLANDEQMAKLREELLANISGDIHEGVNDEFMRPMFRDFDAVKAAWNELVQENGGKERYSLKTDSQGRALTEQQREYFKDSKAVDGQGRLLVLYHGTGAKFTVFDKTRIGENFADRGSDLGFYFSPYVEDANGYAREAAGYQGNGEVMQVYLNLKNPLVIEDEGWGSAIGQADIRHGDLKRWAQDGGHDGIIVKSTDIEMDDDGTPDAVYIAFSPNQIKSTDNKAPTSDPDIRYSLKEYTDEEKKQHVKDAAAYFGRTYKWAETGYITTDGKRLDFSGRHEGGPGGYRTVDHRDIRDALGDDYGGDDYSGSMVQFMSEGNIRIMPESGGINLSVMPTKAQVDVLSDFISKQRGEVILDIDTPDGNTVSSTEYPRGTHSSKVLSDIKAYFEDGTKPYVSDVARFRYSLKTDSQGRALTEQQREYFKDSKAVDDQGRLMVMYHGTRKGGFTVFRDWSYLTANRKYAERYMDRDTGETMYEVYANIKKPFDTRLEECRAIWENEFYGEYSRTDLQESGLPDWTDGYDLVDFLEENGYDYDAILLDEGADQVNGSIVERGISYVVRSSEQIKSITNENPTSDPDIRYSLKPVPPVRPKSKDWRPGATFDEVKAAHPTLFALDADEADTRNPTQISGTVKSYRKIYDALKAEGFDGTILDASSGLGYGTRAGREEYGFQVDDIEPFPDEKYKPMFTDYSTLEKTYDVIINNAVLNVMPQDLRDALVVKMGEMLKPGGRAFINVRGTDVKNASSKVAINDDLMEYFISNTGSYQKGFTQRELVAYLKDALGDGFSVEPTKKFGGVSAIVTRDLARYSRSNRDILDAYVKEYGAIPRGEKPSREIVLPKKTAGGKNLSQTVRTILEAGATPDEMVPTIEKLAAKGDFSYDTYTDKQAVSDAESGVKRVGWAQALSDWTNSVNRGEVSKANTAMGWALYNNAANKGDTETAITILEKMVEHQRSAAQALQATRILKKLSPETQLYGVQRSVANLQEELNERYGEKDGPTLKIDPELAERFIQARDQEERDEALKDIYRDIGRQIPSRFRDKWNAWRYLAMLGNPRTHVRNVVGNAGFAPVVAAKNLTATVIEEAVYRVSGGKLERSKGLVLPGKKGRALLEAAWNDYAKVQETALGGGKYSDFANANKYVEEGRVIFRTKALEKARKANSAALDAEDVWFSKPHYAYAMAQYCKAHNITPEQIATGKGLKQARAYAVLEAQKATYRDTNALSQTISEIGRSIRPGKNPVRKGVSLVMEGILPFRKTPANILARGLEYSPIGLINGIKQAVLDVQNGNKTGAEAIDSISAGLTGTGLLALGAWLAAQGLVRGHGGEDEKENELEELMGHQAYALELPNGTSVTLDWLAPEALPFFVGVNLWEQTGGEQEDVTLSSILSAVSTVSEPMLEMSCLQSLNDVFDAVGYASSEGLDGLPAALASAATSYLTQGLPTILGQAERTGEDKRYTTYTEKNAFLTGDMQYTLGRASARVPGWDYQQIPYIDAWGRVEQSGNTGARAFNNFLNPAYTSTINESAMESELLRLYEATGESGVLPSRARKYFTVDKERKDLTAEEYVQYAMLKGQTSYELVTELTQSVEYQSMSDEEKVKAVKDAYDLANQSAKEAVSDYEPDAWIGKAAEAEKKYGISQETYITLKTNAAGIQSLKDADGETISNSKGLQIMEMVYNTPGLTDKQRKAMFEYLGVGKSVQHLNKAAVKEKLEKMRKQSK